MGREVGGGFRIGNTCTPVADSCWSMAKPMQYCKVKNELKNKEKNETKIFATKRKKSLTGRYKIECVILILIMIYFFLILNSPRS